MLVILRPLSAHNLRRNLPLLFQIPTPCQPTMPGHVTKSLPTLALKSPMIHHTSNKTPDTQMESRVGGLISPSVVWDHSRQQGLATSCLLGLSLSTGLPCIELCTHILKVSSHEPQQKRTGQDRKMEKGTELYQSYL